MRVKCTICGRPFNYGDENSPMFKDKIWNDIVNHFGLSEFEKEASKRFYSFIKKGIGLIDKIVISLFVVSVQSLLLEEK